MIDLKPGDMFAVNSGSMIAGAINGVAGFWSSDSSSKYNHAGIVISNDGETFEALRKLDCYHLDQYKGRPILIVRPLPANDFNADSLKRKALFQLMLQHRGQKYPWWRIGLHLFPPLARKLSYKGLWLVCSELCAKFSWKLKIRHEQYVGTTPDQLADEWIHWKEFEVLYEGIWQG